MRVPLNPSDLIWLLDGQDARLVPIGEVFPDQPSLKKSRHPGPLRLTSLGDYNHDGVPLTRLDLALFFFKGLLARPLYFLFRQLAIGQGLVNDLVFLIQKKIRDIRRQQIIPPFFSRSRNTDKGRGKARREPRE
jgi:hypothetical protein